MRSVTAVPQKLQNPDGQEKRSDVLDRLGEAPVRRTINTQRILGPVNQTVDTTSVSSRPETTSTSKEKRRPGRSF